MFKRAQTKLPIIIGNKLISRDDIEFFIYRWNTNYPIDRWWREKHKVAFNSPEHRVISFLDMYIEWLEDKLYMEAKIKKYKNSNYKVGDWLEEEKIDLREQIESWKNIDYSKLDD